MNRLLLSAGAVVLSLALTATAEAGSKGGSKGGSNSHYGSVSHNYQLTYGVKLKSGGYCYKGKDHCHWSYSCWDKRYGCTCYWCPSACCYYYWCPPDDCYYPVDYCPYGKYGW
jgi:hypothetical protein